MKGSELLAKRLPHIVYILADDLGYGDVSCLNREARLRTPRMDRVAAEGMAFTDAHSNSAVCTPTRYGVMTGRYAWRGQLKKGVLRGWSPPLIEEGRTTVASLLRDQGYATACVGKWHLGLGFKWSDGVTPHADVSTDDSVIDYRVPLSGGAHTVGFDESFVLPASLDMPPYLYVHNGRVVQAPTEQAAGSDDPFWRGGPRSPGFGHGTCLLELTRRAEATIDHHAAAGGDRPLLLYFPTPSPHAPHVPRPPFQETSGVGRYGDYVHEHDWSVGVLLDALERNGMADDTLVIITSDNGAHIRGDAFDFERDYGHRSNHIYRGQKSDCWDGGHRVPFIARWPGVIEPGSTCDDLVCLTDLLATAAELTGTALPQDAGEDSVSMAPLLRGEAPHQGREGIIHHSISGEFAIRKSRWKLITCKGSGGWSLPEQAAPADALTMQLYDVLNDPREQHNLIGQHDAVAQELLALLNRYRETDRSVAR